MKAWIVKEKDKFCSTVVFAETRNKAKSLAKKTEACESVEYIDIEVRRLPIADSEYSGRIEMDWNDPDDRLFLVQNCDFFCEEIVPYECDKCSAKNYCMVYQDKG